MGATRHWRHGSQLAAAATASEHTHVVVIDPQCHHEATHRRPSANAYARIVIRYPTPVASRWPVHRMLTPPSRRHFVDTVYTQI